mgnify:CR=1 FL=1
MFLPTLGTSYQHHSAPCYRMWVCGVFVDVFRVTFLPGRAHVDNKLDNVEERRVVESRIHSEREARFRREKDQQQKMLQDARAERTREEQRSERLETQFEENEIRIGERH